MECSNVNLVADRKIQSPGGASFSRLLSWN